jgi:hypothetical protein
MTIPPFLDSLLAKLNFDPLAAFVAIATWLSMALFAPHMPHPIAIAALIYCGWIVVSDRLKRVAVQVKKHEEREKGIAEYDQWASMVRGEIAQCSEIVRRHIRKCVLALDPTFALYRPENHHTDLRRLERCDVIFPAIMGLPRITDHMFEILLSEHKAGRLNEYLNLKDA